MNTLKYKDNEKDALMWLLWKGMEITKSNKKYDIFDRLYNEISKTDNKEKDSIENSDTELHEMYENMQYYLEYCQKNGYVTPMEWLSKYKHF